MEVTHRFEHVAALHVAAVRRLHHHAVVLHRAFQKLLQVAPLLPASRVLWLGERHNLSSTAELSICTWLQESDAQICSTTFSACLDMAAWHALH